MIFIIHKNRGNKPKHAISDEIKDSVIGLKENKYKEANFNHFQELLEKHEDIQVSYSSVYRILAEAGIKVRKNIVGRKPIIEGKENREKECWSKLMRPHIHGL